jgi:hypothetical protein
MTKVKTSGARQTSRSPYAALRRIRTSAFALVAALLLIFTATACLGIRINPGRSGDIYLDDPVMAKGADAQSGPIDRTNVFRSTDDRIYCTISIRGPDGVHLGARWYYMDKLITDRVIDLGTQRRGAWWLQRPPRGAFPVGDYRIEIYLVKSADKVAYFKVVE